TSPALPIFVIDGVDGQLFFLNSISNHYHSNDAINLSLTAIPPPQEGDEIVWEWKWPDADWTVFPGPSGLSHTLTGEQALDGVQVRATLDYADEEKESFTTEPKTLYVDDHGAADLRERRAPVLGPHDRGRGVEPAGQGLDSAEGLGVHAV